MLLIYSCSTCGVSKELVLIYDTNSYANIGTICKYLRNTVSRNYVTVTCDYSLRYNVVFFYRIGKIGPVLKKSSCLSLSECLCKNKSLSITQILIDKWHLHKLFFMAELLMKLKLKQELTYMAIKKLEVPWRYPLIPTVLPRIWFELIISATIGFTTFKKLYCQHPFKIIDGSLIMNLFLLGQCRLKAIRFHR